MSLLFIPHRCTRKGECPSSLLTPAVSSLQQCCPLCRQLQWKAIGVVLLLLQLFSGACAHRCNHSCCCDHPSEAVPSIVSTITDQFVNETLAIGYSYPVIQHSSSFCHAIRLLDTLRYSPSFVIDGLRLSQSSHGSHLQQGTPTATLRSHGVGYLPACQISVPALRGLCSVLSLLGPHGTERAPKHRSRWRRCCPQRSPQTCPVRLWGEQSQMLVLAQVQLQVPALESMR